MRAPTRHAMAASLALLVMPCSARAQPPDARPLEPSEEDLIATGIQLRKEGRDAEALGAFERAYAQHPSPRAIAQIALAHHALAQWREAERGLVEALAASEDAWVTRNRLYLEESLAVVRTHLGWLDVDSNVVGAELSVDGERCGRLPLAAPLRVVAGELTVVVRAPGYAALERVLLVPAGSQVHAPFSFVLEPAPEPRVNADASAPASASAGHPGSARRTAGWITLAGTGALVLVGIGGLVTREWEATIWNDDNQCGPTPGESRAARCGTNRDIGTAALPIGIGALAGAAVAGTVSGVLLFATSPPAAGRTTGHFDCRLAGPGFDCAGAF